MNKPLYRCDGKVPDCAKTTCGYITKDLENGCFLTSKKEHGLYEVDIRNDQDPMLSIFGISKDDLRKCIDVKDNAENDFVVIALPRDQVSDFENMIRRELDYMHGCCSNLMMYQNVPRIKWQLTKLSKQIEAYESILKQLVYA